MRPPAPKPSDAPPATPGVRSAAPDSSDEPPAAGGVLSAVPESSDAAPASLGVRSAVPESSDAAPASLGMRSAVPESSDVTSAGVTSADVEGIGVRSAQPKADGVASAGGLASGGGEGGGGRAAGGQARGGKAVRPWPSPRKAGTVAAGLAVAGVLAGLAASVVPVSGQWTTLLVLVAIVAFGVCAVMTALWIVLRRHPGISPRPAWAPGQHRKVLRAIQRDEPLTGPEHDLARIEATRIRQMWPVDLTAVIAALLGVLILIGLTLAGDIERFHLYFQLLLLPFGLYRLADIHRTHRAAANYLTSTANHPAAATDHS